MYFRGLGLFFVEVRLKRVHNFTGANDNLNLIYKLFYYKIKDANKIHCLSFPPLEQTTRGELCSNN